MPAVAWRRYLVLVAVVVAQGALGGVQYATGVPEVLVSSVLDWLAERGFGDIEEVTSADEHLQFALPPELRRDLRARDKAATSA